jgi:coenzyme PQQ precursor peptide PqqA
MIMAWTTPNIVEICVGLEINGYLPSESRLAAGT